MLAFSNDYYGFIFRATQSVELFCAYVEKELKEGTLIQIPLSDFMVMHDFTFLWNKDSIFSQEYETIFQELQSKLST